MSSHRQLPLVNLSIIHPRLLFTITLIEFVILDESDDRPKPAPVSTGIWDVRAKIEMSLRKAFATWDQGALDKVPTIRSTGSVHCSLQHQSDAAYFSIFCHFDYENTPGRVDLPATHFSAFGTKRSWTRPTPVPSLAPYDRVAAGFFWA